MIDFLHNLPPLNFVQALGFLSFLLGVACFYQKDDRKLKIIMIIMCLNNTLHFALLGALTASLGSALAVLRTYISIKSTSKRVAFSFILLTLIIGGISSHAWYDMLPIIGSCLGTYALFCLSGIQMRSVFVVGACCWLANNIIVGSVGTSLLEMTLIIVNLSTIYRLMRKTEAKINRP